MLYILGVLIALGCVGLFGGIGLLTLWGGVETLRTEVPRDYVRSQAGSGARLTTLTLMGLPMLITAIFGIITALRFLQVAFGMA
ncbi:hypothetical protein [Candidatus Viridilinea mediisalina]|uniref:Uncharacterized protein n=1 Tax=Candidatus Viridilinea mediisalina TaxID=2024553 RepID=A0A2A6RFM7_9CHLR|nr:hypothetical protein [Candidatus Viridilinea mediisalina]PDW01877.1 hypothetical protein CJ255_16910 [Candidatus Viridilinea mediisalina]